MSHPQGDDSIGKAGTFKEIYYYHQTDMSFDAMVLFSRIASFNGDDPYKVLSDTFTSIIADVALSSVDDYSSLEVEELITDYNVDHCDADAFRAGFFHILGLIRRAMAQIWKNLLFLSEETLHSVTITLKSYNAIEFFFIQKAF